MTHRSQPERTLQESVPLPPQGSAAFPDAFRPKVHEDLIVDDPGSSDGEVILLHPTEARWTLTNGSGLALARRLDGSATVVEIARTLAADFNVDLHLVLHDIGTFLAQLQRNNLLANAPLQKEVRATKEEKPPSMTVYITEQCNLRCKHCAIVEGKMPSSLLSNNDVKQLIDEHTDRYSNPTVSFLGGEPFMREDCVELLEYAASKTNNVNVSTNGFYIDDAMAGRLGPLGINVQVSLDGADPEVNDFIRGKNSYEKAWAAIGRLSAAGGARRITIATTLTRSVLSQVRQMIARCDKLGIGKIRFSPLNKTKAAETNWEAIGPDPETFKEILHYIIFDANERDGAVTEVSGGFPGFVPHAEPGGAHWCPLGKTLIVDSQGEVFTCPSLEINEVRLGNVKEESLRDLDRGFKAQAAREQMLHRRYAVPECQSCAWRNFCQGGCAAFMYHHSGSLFINDEFCEFRRDLYREHVIRQAQQEVSDSQR